MDEKITKATLIDEVYGRALVEYKINKNEKCPYSKEDISYIVGEFISALTDNLKQGNTVELRGLGSFEKKKRAARSNMRNPRTGQEAVSKEHYVMTFRSGKELKEAVWDL